MKKGLLCILLSVFLLTPIFASCQQTTEITDVEAPIYTLYTITEESTTPEAIRQVELALNRILFYRLGVILKLEMVTEDEYDELIASKFEEIAQYQEEKKKSSKDKNTSSESTDEEVSEEVLTGDMILEMLEKGGEIPLEEPRLDIFLVRGYDSYYDYATNNKLAALDEKLNNEAKKLKSAIHSIFFSAATVNKKTYGVPINTAIGEYTYLAFDEEYLQKYNIDPNTITSLADLQDYLAEIKANEPDVIPLECAMPSADISFLVNDGFPALVKSGAVHEAYEDTELLDYFAMIARYRALGYFESTSGNEDANYAVRFVKGNEDTVAALEKETNRSYSTSVYSNPVATNENTIDNIFCVSKFVVSNELTAVMEILTALNTDEQLMNILTYGVEGVNFILNDNGQVERLDDTYMMNPQYTGNSFITYTLAGENKDKWNNAILQNQDAIASPSLGFTIEYKSFEYKNEDKEEVVVYEPNYIDIINSVVDKYYPTLMSGSAIEFDYQEVYNSAVEQVDIEIKSELLELYETQLKAQYFTSITDSVTARYGDDLKAEATETIIESVKKNLINPLKALLKTEIQAEFPEATEEEIDQMIEERLTDEYINDHLYYQYSEERVNEMIDGTYQNLINSKVNEELEEFVKTSTYKSALNKLLVSDKYLSDLEKMRTYDAPDRVNDAFDSMIADSIAEYTTNIITEISTELEAGIDAFIAEYSETLDLTEEQILIKIGFADEPEEEEEEEAEDNTESEDSTEEEDTGFENYFDFVFTVKLKQMYYSIFGEPTA